MSRYGIELYSIARSGDRARDRLEAVRQPQRREDARAARADSSAQMARAKSFGIEFEFVSPAEAGRIAPILRTDDLAGAVWIPGDGKANPTDLTQSLARGARMRRRAHRRGRQGHRRDGRRRAAWPASTWRTADGAGAIAARRSSTAAASGRASSARRAGVNVPLYAAEHFYIVTKPIAGVTPDLPVIRDPDGFIYYKEEVGGLVMGGFEPVAKPWNVVADSRRLRVPAAARGLGPVRDPDDQRDPPHAVPRDGADQDAAERPGELHAATATSSSARRPRSRGYFVCAGFNSAGIANSGGAGRLVAEWIVGGEAPLDLWDVDIRRFAPFHANRRHLADRTVESLGLHYAMRWPREELHDACGRCAARRSTTACAAKGAVFGTKLNWERANYFLPAGRSASRRPRSTRPAGCRGCSTSSAPAARTSSCSTRRRSRNSCSRAAMRSPCCSACARTRSTCPSGRMVYTAMLNARGGFESDLTITRARARHVLHPHRLGAGDARRVVDRAAHRRRRVRRAGRRHERVFGDLADGPEGGGAAARRCRPTTCRRPALPFSTTRRDRRRLRARARRAHELRRRARATRWSCRPTSA